MTRIPFKCKTQANEENMTCHALCRILSILLESEVADYAKITTRHHAATQTNFQIWKCTHVGQGDAISPVGDAHRRLMESSQLKKL
jgi:hypothetical protein